MCLPYVTSFASSQMKRINMAKWSDICSLLCRSPTGQSVQCLQLCEKCMTVAYSCRKRQTHSQNTHTHTSNHRSTHTFAELSYQNPVYWAMIECDIRENRHSPRPTTFCLVASPYSSHPHLQGHASIQRGSQGLSAGAEICPAVDRRVSVPAFPKPSPPKPRA